MSYQKKYYYTFVKLRTTEIHTVELWQNTGATLTAVEVQGHMNPFIVEMPEIDHKFQVVRGSGCTINLLSKTDGQFFTGLYHVDPQEFMVKHYIGGSLNWVGYLNTEMTDEPYDIDFNYPFSITGNDGFALMDRFSFVQSDLSIYTGIKSQFEILQICLNKIALPYNEIRIALATTGITMGVNESLLHVSYINCANFYDEDNKPMSLREVLESILAPYGAYIRLEDTNIQICDIDTLARNSTITYQRFTQSTGAYAGAIAIPNTKDISTIKHAGTGSRKELSGGFNRQVVSYSPYPLKTIMNESLIGTDEFTTNPEWSIKDEYHYKTLEGNTYWEIDFAKQVSLNPSTFEISYYINEEDANVYLRYPRYGGSNGRVAYIKDNPYLNISGATINTVDTDPDRPIRIRTKYYDGVSFNITGQVLVKTKDNPYNEEILSKEIVMVGLSCRIKVGNKYYNPAIKGWEATATNFTIYVKTSNNEIIADKFVEFSEVVIIGNISEEILLDGQLEFEIWSEYISDLKDGITTPVTNSTDIEEIWVKQVSIELVNYDGLEIEDNDKEYIGLLDKSFQNEGQKIELTCGTDTQFADRGKILQFDGTEYKDVKLWTRAGQSFKIEELLLGSISSNYRSGFITLSGLKLKQAFSLQNVITDTSYLSTKRLMVKSATINYHDNIIECSLIEISKDELTIVY
jgi:hypothetical protein